MRAGLISLLFVYDLVLCVSNKNFESFYFKLLHLHLLLFRFQKESHLEWNPSLLRKKIIRIYELTLVETYTEWLAKKLIKSNILFSFGSAFCNAIFSHLPKWNFDTIHCIKQNFLNKTRNLKACAYHHFWFQM